MATSKPIRFPRDPLEGRDRAFVDEQGKNLFADVAAGSVTNENVYAAPAEGAAQPDQPSYEAILLHRGSIIVRLGGIGLGLILAIMLAAVFQPAFALLAIFDLALTIPVWIMGHHDLKAIRAGAMDSAGLQLTWAGTWMAILGTVVTIAFSWSLLGFPLL